MDDFFYTQNKKCNYAVVNPFKSKLELLDLTKPSLWPNTSLVYEK